MFALATRSGPGVHNGWFSIFTSFKRLSEKRCDALWQRLRLSAADVDPDDLRGTIGKHDVVHRELIVRLNARAGGTAERHPRFDDARIVERLQEIARCVDDHDPFIAP